MSGEPVVDARLNIQPWDIERWRASRAYRLMSLAAQGAYLNLCFAAWGEQPSCVLRDDNRELWRHANARSLDEWKTLREEVLGCSDAWSKVEGGLLNEVVLETYQESLEKHRRAVASGRVAGKASARARRALVQAKRAQQHRTAVQRPSNDRSTTVNPPSPSPSPSPSTEAGEAGGGCGGDHVENHDDAARPPEAQGSGTADGHGWVDHDPADPEQARLASLVEQIEGLDAERDGRPADHEGARAMLAAVSGTRSGDVIDGSLRGVRSQWIRQSIAQAYCFAREEFGVDLATVDRAPPEKAADVVAAPRET